MSNTRMTVAASIARIESDDECAEKVGAKLVEVLKLRPAKGYTPPRFITDWGTKTAIGVARSVVAILTEAA